MAGDFLRKLLGRKPELPADVAEARTELTRLAAEQPALAELAGLVADLLPALYAEPVRALGPALTREKAAEKLAAGVPLLRGETVDVDWPALTRRLRGAIDILAERRAEAAPALARAVASREVDLAALTSAILTGQPQALHERTEALGLDVPLAASVLSLSLFPVFGTVRASLGPLSSAGPWEQGYCPVCGSFSRLGEFRGLEQTRILRCGLCAAEWPFPRLRCPGCGNRDHRQLGYLHVEGEEGKCRAATCDVCRQYVKMVSTLGPLSALKLVVTDVATVHLDLLAAEHGYSPPA